MPWQEKDKRDLHGEKRKREICMAREGKEILDPVGSTVRYEMMKLCTGSV